MSKIKNKFSVYSYVILFDRSICKQLNYVKFISERTRPRPLHVTQFIRPLPLQ